LCTGTKRTLIDTNETSHPPYRGELRSSLEEIPNREGHPLTAVIVVAIALLLGAGLVISQLVRLRTWLGKPPPDAPPDSGEE